VVRVLVLGGRGFLGRHVAAALTACGHRVVVGSRDGGATAAGAPVRGIRCERLVSPGSWDIALADVDAVVNCVGILRERGAATYDRVHHLAPAALAADCARLSRRLVHVSALGLRADARSRFIRSKLHGEAAIRASGADWTIVRPSLLDGVGGFGARWLRAMARWPVHAVPADAIGRIAMLDVDDAGRAIAKLCAMRGDECREADLGGLDELPLHGHLAALRARTRPSAARVVRVPAWVARIGSHACDVLRFSPFSFGHLELLRHDNLPRVNALPRLLGMPPRRVGAAVRAARATASAPSRAILPPNAIRDDGSRPIARAP
jgi:NADH dehydrogenase